MAIEDSTDEIINRSEYGGWIPVDNVQQLASKNLKHVPHRYIRPEIASEELLVDESLQVPVIDSSKLVIPGQPGYDDELAKLHLACKHWGFFQLINHGVSETIDEMKKVTEEFFNLPLEEKMKCAQIQSSIEGYGTAFVVSEEQKLDWGDTLFLLPLPVSTRNLRFWPQNPNSFRKTLDEYSSVLFGVSLKLFELISINIGVEPEVVSKLYDNCTQGIRMNYYPPCPEAHKVLGCSPHSDATGLTLLTQVGEVQGLQIRKNSKWVPIKPIPGSIIVNVGDVLEILSNGEYSSIEHRVVADFEKKRISIAAFHNPGLETTIGPLAELVKETRPKFKPIDILSNGEYSSIEHRVVADFEKERISIAAFHNPGLETTIGPLAELVKETRPKFKPIDATDYMRLVINSELDGKSLVDYLRIE